MVVIRYPPFEPIVPSLADFAKENPLFTHACTGWLVVL
jgi:hypothetical protein